MNTTRYPAGDGLIDGDNGALGLGVPALIAGAELQADASPNRRNAAGRSRCQRPKCFKACEIVTRPTRQYGAVPRFTARPGEPPGISIIRWCAGSKPNAL